MLKMKKKGVKIIKRKKKKVAKRIMVFMSKKERMEL